MPIKIKMIISLPLKNLSNYDVTFKSPIDCCFVVRAAEIFPRSAPSQTVLDAVFSDGFEPIETFFAPAYSRKRQQWVRVKIQPTQESQDVRFPDLTFLDFLELQVANNINH
ncbi:hypothetical protein G7K_1924-t1 [Saitoella complicata NRRL Y-17804]|uniref:Uncharacterized protein n=1 Tax=Saitoella complicata (strain BCRC 22490 / CBS 7301 / JCM 7358 / NBRC 10748 / NRRL Y-17804) TaxID=698492 RepID=A0A0E9NE85_SAICN|nr:hypothetical protein G7K_1924-t1 [Saitoella complicata NRRL Y-17804]